MPCDCSCVLGDAPGVRFLCENGLEGSEDPFPTPFPHHFRVCDKKCRGTVHAARGRRMMSTQGLPHSEGVGMRGWEVGGGQSDYHVDITVSDVVSQRFFIPPLPVIRVE